jgi:hypothetical protein
VRSAWGLAAVVYDIVNDVDNLVDHGNNGGQGRVCHGKSLAIQLE